MTPLSLMPCGSIMKNPFAAGQLRLAILGQRAVKVRLVRAAPEGVPAWICAVEGIDPEPSVASENLFVIGEADIGKLLPE